VLFTEVDSTTRQIFNFVQVHFCKNLIVTGCRPRNDPLVVLFTEVDSTTRQIFNFFTGGTFLKLSRGPTNGIFKRSFFQ
jgi:hypothetical protein